MLKFSIYIILTLIFIVKCNETRNTESLPNTNKNILQNNNEVENLNQKINEQHEIQDKDITKISLDKLETTTKISQNKYDGDDNFSFMYLLTPISLLIIFLIILRTMRLKKSRAEIKYGDAERTELKPLPMALDESSDENEDNDQTLFDINQLRNSRSGYVA